MSAGRLTLKAWIAHTYAEGSRPTINRVRRWCRDKKIEPPPVKEGRSYFFEPFARYNDGPQSASRRLINRVREHYENRTGYVDERISDAVSPLRSGKRGLHQDR